jgi:hypothetical protein
MNTKEEILEKHCPSMNNLYLDNQGRNFRDRIIKAMEEYASQQTAEATALLLNSVSKEQFIELQKELSDFKALVKKMRGMQSPKHGTITNKKYEQQQFDLETQVDKYLQE